MSDGNGELSVSREVILIGRNVLTCVGPAGGSAIGGLGAFCSTIETLGDDVELLVYKLCCCRVKKKGKENPKVGILTIGVGHWNMKADSGVDGERQKHPRQLLVKLCYHRNAQMWLSAHIRNEFPIY